MLLPKLISSIWQHRQGVVHTLDTRMPSVNFMEVAAGSDDIKTTLLAYNRGAGGTILRGNGDASHGG